MFTPSLAIRITAWYDWLWAVLVLVLGVYTCKSLEYFLSIGVQEVIAMRAKEINHRFAATGRLPGPKGFALTGLNDSFIEAYPGSASTIDLSDQGATRMTLPGAVRHVAAPVAGPKSILRRNQRDARLFVAADPGTIGNEKYMIEMGVTKRPIKALFREAAVTLLFGLMVGLTIGTCGSFIAVKRALNPIHKIAEAVEALPGHPKPDRQGIDVLEEFDRLCLKVNGMIDQLENSFPIGTGFQAEAINRPTTQLRTLRGECGKFFRNERLENGFGKALLKLLRETERLSNLSQHLAAPSTEGFGPTRTERLRFYFGDLTARRVERVCALTKRLAAELTFEARNSSGQDSLTCW